MYLQLFLPHKKKEKVADISKCDMERALIMTIFIIRVEVLEHSLLTFSLYTVYTITFSFN